MAHADSTSPVLLQHVTRLSISGMDQGGLRAAPLVQTTAPCELSSSLGSPSLFNLTLFNEDKWTGISTLIQEGELLSPTELPCPVLLSALIYLSSSQYTVPSAGQCPLALVVQPLILGVRQKYLSMNHRIESSNQPGWKRPLRSSPTVAQHCQGHH